MASSLFSRAVFEGSNNNRTYDVNVLAMNIDSINVSADGKNYTLVGTSVGTNKFKQDGEALSVTMTKEAYGRFLGHNMKGNLQMQGEEPEAFTGSRVMLERVYAQPDGSLVAPRASVISKMEAKVVKGAVVPTVTFGAGRELQEGYMTKGSITVKDVAIGGEKPFNINLPLEDMRRDANGGRVVTIEQDGKRILAALNDEQWSTIKAEIANIAAKTAASMKEEGSTFKRQIYASLNIWDTKTEAKVTSMADVEAMAKSSHDARPWVLLRNDKGEQFTVMTNVDKETKAQTLAKPEEIEKFLQGSSMVSGMLGSRVSMENTLTLSVTKSILEYYDRATLSVAKDAQRFASAEGHAPSTEAALVWAAYGSGLGKAGFQVPSDVEQSISGGPKRAILTVEVQEHEGKVYRNIARVSAENTLMHMPSQFPEIDNALTKRAEETLAKRATQEAPQLASEVASEMTSAPEVPAIQPMSEAEARSLDAMADAIPEDFDAGAAFDEMMASPSGPSMG